MPTTPFIGFSIIIHIGIIIFHKFFNWKPGKQKKQTRLRYAFGCLIVVGMFSGVLTMAGLLVHASIVENHSAFRVAQNSGVLLVSFIESNTVKAVAAVSENTQIQSIRTDTQPHTNMSYTSREVAFGMVVLLTLFILFLPYLFKAPKRSNSLS